MVEGAYLTDGKSLSKWDVLCHSVGCGPNGESGAVVSHVCRRRLECVSSVDASFSSSSANGGIDGGDDGHKVKANPIAAASDGISPL
ncbi:hypothetical protein L1887_39449 [Cichorium endivia]|nr:hypothetical protein L1887_39449 [Cichorium endivia]